MRWTPAWESDNWCNDLVVSQSPAGKNVSMEAEDLSLSYNW
jgi:hypothetical protein